MTTERRPTKPLVLTRRRLALRLKSLAPEFPAELVQVAIREITEALALALAAGRPISLRGFGHFQVRRYHNSAKRVGVIFRPSPDLTHRVNVGLTQGEPKMADG